MSTLQSLAEPVNQTSFARAIRLGTMSALDAIATEGQMRADNVEMALRWYHAAESYMQDGNLEEMAALGGLRMTLRGFNLYV